MTYAAQEILKVSSAYLVARYSRTAAASVLSVARMAPISSRSLQPKTRHQCARFDRSKGLICSDMLALFQ
jgi:hypothetical protein